MEIQTFSYTILMKGKFNAPVFQCTFCAPSASVAVERNMLWTGTSSVTLSREANVTFPPMECDICKVYYYVPLLLCFALPNIAFLWEEMMEWCAFEEEKKHHVIKNEFMPTTISRTTHTKLFWCPRRVRFASFPIILLLETLSTFTQFLYFFSNHNRLL